MKERYLEVTYRDGRPIAAYLYLPHPPRAKSVNTRRLAGGLIADFASDGTPIGIEVTAPDRITSAILNCALRKLGQPPVTPGELGPLAAA